jgi:hypothetical protein
MGQRSSVRMESRAGTQVKKQLEAISESEPSVTGVLVPDQPPAPVDVTSEERHQRISVAAYHRAESRGFAPGYQLNDWFDAEAEIQSPRSVIRLNSKDRTEK